MVKRKKTKRVEKTQPELKPRITASVRLTPIEAVHLRDLFSIMLPPDGSKTVSQSLAAGAGRSLVETRLWHKLHTACQALGVPLGDEAPDFVVAPTAMPMPELAVQQIEVQHDLSGQEEAEDSTLAIVMQGVEEAAPAPRSKKPKKGKAD